MNGLHSWSGLLFGWVLFAVFLTGTLTVFDNEITSWMQPELQEVTSAAGDLEEAPRHLIHLASQADRREGDSPVDGMRALGVKWQNNRTFSGQTIDPITGQLVTFRDTQGGDFFYHFHYGLLLGPPGAWLVGAAGMAMFVALFTGLVIHRRIFKDWLTFRPQSFPHRAWLDAHNVTGILVLPFHLMITLTGLVILWSIYLSASMSAGIPLMLGHHTALLVPLADTDRPAQFSWERKQTERVFVNHPGDQHALAAVFQRSDNHLILLTDRVNADGMTGETPGIKPAYGPTSSIQSVLFDLHFAQFGGAILRWLYFIMGLAASTMIATGLVLWTIRRRRYYAERSHAANHRLVESLNVAAVPGLLVAIAAFFWANRLLPLPLPGRASWEIGCFFFAWFLCLVQSLLRAGSPAVWKAQLYVAAVLLGLLPLLNALTTNVHLFVTVPKGQWAVAGVDLTALAAGALLGWTARRLGRTDLEKSGSRTAPMTMSNTESERI